MQLEAYKPFHLNPSPDGLVISQLRPRVRHGGHDIILLSGFSVSGARLSARDLSGRRKTQK